MASHGHLDDEDDFGVDFAGGNAVRRSGNKKSFGDLDDDEDDIFGSKKMVFMKEKLEEKDDEIRRLKHELHGNDDGIVNEQNGLATETPTETNAANDDRVTPIEVVQTDA